MSQFLYTFTALALFALFVLNADRLASLLIDLGESVAAMFTRKNDEQAGVKLDK